MSLGAPIDTRSHVHDPNTIYSPEVALMEVFCRFSLPQTMSSMYRQQQLLCSEFVVDVFQLILRPALISMNQSIDQSTCTALHCTAFLLHMCFQVLRQPPLHGRHRATHLNDLCCLYDPDQVCTTVVCLLRWLR
jgi:hypothetical protein